jgi:WD40 repeat protein
MNNSPLFCSRIAIIGTLALVVTLLSGCAPGEPPVNSQQIANRGLFSAALSEDGHYLVAGSLYHGGSFWRLDTNERLFNWNHEAGDFSPLTAVTATAHGNFAVTVVDDQLVLWDGNKGNSLTFFVAPATIQDAKLGPNGRYALLGLSDRTAVLFDAMRGGIQRTFAHDGRVLSVDMNADGTLAITGAEDQQAILWDIASGEPRFRWPHNNEVRLVRMSPDGKRVISVSKYDRTAIWDTTSGEMIGQIPQSRWRIVRGEVFTSAAFSADGSLILTGTTARDVHLWQMPGPTLVKTWTLPRREEMKRSAASVLAVGFTDTQGEYRAVSADGMIHRLKR